jgi:hypothetical protein
MERAILHLWLNDWEIPVIDGDPLPTAGSRVIIRVENKEIFILPIFETDRLPGDVTYTWPAKPREEAARLAWAHLENRMRQARINHYYPCCGGEAFFFPTWLSLCLSDYVTLADERICPACTRYWSVEATVKSGEVEEVIWLYRSKNARRNPAKIF